MKHSDADVGYSKESVSESAADNGRTAGTSVWCLEGTNLKGIRNATPQVSLFFSALGWLLFDQAMYINLSLSTADEDDPDMGCSSKLTLKYTSSYQLSHQNVQKEEGEGTEQDCSELLYSITLTALYYILESEILIMFGRLIQEHTPSNPDI